MTELNIIRDDYGASICKECDDTMKSFIDIYIENEDTPSLFKEIKDAELFAEIIVKLLRVMLNDN